MNIDRRQCAFCILCFNYQSGKSICICILNTFNLTTSILYCILNTFWLKNMYLYSKYFSEVFSHHWPWLYFARFRNYGDLLVETSPSPVSFNALAECFLANMLMNLILGTVFPVRLSTCPSLRPSIAAYHRGWNQIENTIWKLTRKYIPEGMNTIPFSLWKGVAESVKEIDRVAILSVRMYLNIKTIHHINLVTLNFDLLILEWRFEYPCYGHFSHSLRRDLLCVERDSHSLSHSLPLSSSSQFGIWTMHLFSCLVSVVFIARYSVLTYLLIQYSITRLFYRAACNATHGIAVAILSVCLSVRPSDACIVTKLNDELWIFWCHTKRQSL